jgi:hypothetical protein
VALGGLSSDSSVFRGLEEIADQAPTLAALRQNVMRVAVTEGQPRPWCTAGVACAWWVAVRDGTIVSHRTCATYEKAFAGVEANEQSTR